MNIADAINVHAAAESAFRGRKPGSLKTRHPGKMLEAAKKMWGPAPDFDLELSREIRTECPHMKAMKFTDMTATQQRNVAGRMHSKAQTRVRAARLKGKSMYPGPPKS